MKRVVTIIAIAVFLGSLITSCKTHERCPAYGKTDQQTEQEAKV